MDYQQTAWQTHSDTIDTVAYDRGNTLKSSQRPRMPETMQHKLPSLNILSSVLELVFTFHTGCDEYLCERKNHATKDSNSNSNRHHKNR